MERFIPCQVIEIDTEKHTWALDRNITPDPLHPFHLPDSGRPVDLFWLSSVTQMELIMGRLLKVLSNKKLTGIKNTFL